MISHPPLSIASFVRNIIFTNHVNILIDRIDSLAEFWKCLAAISSNDRVNLWQFKEATKCWITKMQEVQSSQDSNNNEREKL